MAVAQGPVAVGIDASSESFKLYKHGVIKTDCGTNINHAALVVGYGQEGIDRYWLLKNSWGTEWGEKGFFKILRQFEIEGKPGVCGIGTKAEYP